jgi:predicted RNase H-like nuclease (RuvC/YqgF family)
MEELNEKCKKLQKDNYDLLVETVEQADKIEALEKENRELKDDLEHNVLI